MRANPYLKLPTFRCKNCDLTVTGNNELEIKNQTEKIYKQKHWGDGNLWDAEKAIDSNYTDEESLGRKHTWISQLKYCKPYIENKKKILGYKIRNPSTGLYLSSVSAQKWTKIGIPCTMNSKKGHICSQGAHFRRFGRILGGFMLILGLNCGQKRTEIKGK